MITSNSEPKACDSSFGKISRRTSRVAPVRSTEAFAMGRRLAGWSERIFRHSPWDALFVLLAALHGLLLITAPSVTLIGVGIWWSSNTIAHNFIHLPFFTKRSWNRLFSAYLSAVLGIPQRLWRDRHLAHHAGIRWRLRISHPLVIESVVVAAVWSLMLILSGDYFTQVYLPGYLLGLGLCFLQGHYEHARGTTSHYGRLYNRCFFNDGYHVEHHSCPGKHWTRLPGQTSLGGTVSRWPAVLRWLEWLSLDSLEGMVLRSTRLQNFVLECHERAFRELLPHLPEIRRVTVVGGGLFPRTALILRKLLPQAHITVFDTSGSHIQTAKAYLNADVEYVHRLYDGSSIKEVDLIVIPLSFIGDRTALYRQPTAPAVCLHDWIWRRRGTTTIISWLLLKRLNLVRG